MNKNKHLARLYAVYQQIAKDYNKRSCFDLDGTFYEVENWVASSRQLNQIISKPSMIVKELEDLRCIHILKRGSISKGNTRVQLKEPPVVDMDNPEFLKELNRIIDKPKVKFLKTNDPTGFYFKDVDFSKVKQNEDESYNQWATRIGDYKKSIENMNSGNLVGKIAICGRVSSDFTSIPKVLRSSLRNQLGEVCDIDINATVPRLMGSIIDALVLTRAKRSTKRIDEWMKAINEEDDSYFDEHKQLYIDRFIVTNDGDLTEGAIALIKEIEDYNQTIVNKEDAYSNLIKELGLNLSRDELKKLILKVIFGTEEDDLKNIFILSISNALRARFPLIHSFLKREAHNYRLNKVAGRVAFNEVSFVRYIFGLESRIIKETSVQLKCPRLTMFDAIYVPSKFKDITRDLLEQKFKELTGVEYRGKISVIPMTAIEKIESLKIKTWIDPKSGKAYYRKIKTIEGKEKRYTILKDSTDLELLEWIKSIS